MKDQILIIGIVVALGVGYLIGSLQGGRTELVRESPAAPSNYDPARAMCADALKQQQEVSDRCYKQVVELLTDKVNAAGKVAHE